MKKNQLYHVLTLLVGLQSSIAVLSNESVDLDALNQLSKNFKVNVHLDNLDNLGEAIGDNTKEIIKETISSIAEGISQAGQDQNFGKNIKEGLGGALEQTSGAFKDAMKKQELIDNIKDGSTEMTLRVGEFAEGTQAGLAQKFWPAIEQINNDALSSIFSWRNMYQFFGPYAISSAASLSAYYGTILAWKLLEQRLLNPKPAILLPGSKVGRWDRVSRWRAGYQSPAMIFDEQIKDRLEEIEEKTKNIRDHIYNGKKATYDNLLLYGKPGTGKTLFAQILADKTNMDFLPVTAGSLLQSGVEGIKYVNELIAMANKSKYGTIIFVDEADALFVDRDSLDPSSDHYKVLNHILALTGSGSNKFMLIAATNHAYVMDSAMGRRFQDRVLMPLPNATTRKELLNLYTTNVLLNKKDNNKEFITAAQGLLTVQQINLITEQTEGLSHAEIKDMVHAMHKKALATKTGIITLTHINNAVKQAVEKSAALEADKIEREQHHKAIA